MNTHSLRWKKLLRTIIIAQITILNFAITYALMNDDLKTCAHNEILARLIVYGFPIIIGSVFIYIIWNPQSKVGIILHDTPKSDS